MHWVIWDAGSNNLVEELDTEDEGLQAVRELVAINSPDFIDDLGLMAMAAAILAEQGLRIATVRDQIVEMLSASLPLPAGFPFSRFVAPAEASGLRISPSRRNPHEGPMAVTSPRSVSADGFTLKELIAWAYRADVRRVEMPVELDTRERYDARVDLPAPHGWPALDRLVQEGINTHFDIEVTHETKSIDVFILTASDGACTSVAS